MNLVDKKNPKSADGQYLTCICCGSYHHLVAICPHSWESVNSITDDEEEANIVLYTGGIKGTLMQIGKSTNVFLFIWK